MSEDKVKHCFARAQGVGLCLKLTYKCENAGCQYLEVNESYTTQTCSCCGSRQNSPKGRTDLRIREWLCECGVTHQRDVNAAKNILALGLERLAVGITVV